MCRIIVLSNNIKYMKWLLLLLILWMSIIDTNAHSAMGDVLLNENFNSKDNDCRPRIIVTTDGEEDDRASFVRFLLTSNEFDIEAIVNTSSQFHWVGGKGWNAFCPPEWLNEYIGYYAKVYPNLSLHDSYYPSPEYLSSICKVGNISQPHEYEERTEGAEFIAQILLDNKDTRPVWIQAWGGCNTIACALKIIQEDYPEKMKEVAGRTKLFLIWEQDESYQKYIRPNWEHLQIPVIISDQFDCMAYIWRKVLPDNVKTYFEKPWFYKNILNGHGALCDAYHHKDQAFNAEGDTPAFLHNIPNGLRNMENPSYGGWGGQYVQLRNNVWIDRKPSEKHDYPKGQWGIANSWSKHMEYFEHHDSIQMRTRYFKPLWRWLSDVQHDFAARADWCVKTYKEANHHPIACLKDGLLNRTAKAGEQLLLDASSSEDPDGNRLYFKWWYFEEASNSKYKPDIDTPNSSKVTIKIPEKALPGEKLHFICEVIDDGEPSLKKYLRVIVKIV